MPTRPDRRDFLHAAGCLAAGVATARATSPPPKPTPKDGVGLKILEGDGTPDLPSGAVRRLGATRMRVTGYVNKLQFSPRGTTLVAASGKELRAWDPVTGRVKFRLGYPDNASIDSGRLTDRDTFVLLVRPHSASKFQIRDYEFGTGKLLGQSPEFDLANTQHNAFSRDGRLMAVIRSDGLALHDAATGVEKWRDLLPVESIGGCLFFPDGTRIALATKGEVRLYDAATGKVTGGLPVGIVKAKEDPNPHGPNWLTDLLVSADGKWAAAAVGEEGNLVACWDVTTAKIRHTVKPASKPLGFAPDGTTLATFKDCRVTIWDLATGKAVREFDVPRHSDLVLSPDGRMIACPAGDSVVLIDAQTGKFLDHSADPPGLPGDLRFADGGRLIGRLVDWGGWVEWDVKATKARLIRPPDSSGHDPSSLSDDGRLAVYTRRDKYRVREVATGKTLRTGTVAEGTDSPVAVLTPNGKRLVVWEPKGLSVTDAAGAGPPIPLRPAGEAADRLVPLVVAADGRSAAQASRQDNDHSSIEIFDLVADRRVHRLTTQGDVGNLSFSADGSLLAAAHDVERRGRFGEQRAAAVYDARSGKAVLTIPPDDLRGNRIALAPNGRVLAQIELVKKPGDFDRGDEYERIVLWEVWGGGVRQKLDAKVDVSSLAFSPDGRILAASVYGGPVFLWDLYALPAGAPAPDTAALDRLWADLITADAGVAFEAIKRLAAFPDSSTPYLREKIAPVAPPERGVVTRLIGDLDHREFRRREAAMRGLTDLGERCRDDLRKTLDGQPTPETRERIGRLLAAEDRPTQEVLRLLRAVEAVEVAGTTQAEKLLGYWSTGAPGAFFTTAAAAAARRLASKK
jgi:WD40 repeat protein